MSDLEHINRKLDIIGTKQEEILRFLDELALAIEGHNPALWIDSLEVMKILRISTSTFYRRRKKGDLVPHPVGGGKLYYAPDIYSKRNHFLK
ncbi:MAG: hypothetical protein Q8S11_08145 [Daejeonella sp.]|uniref:helix-turn-helix transcriptional regulator n=1 Tax=Daejeonella sp. TaxID=2805397 RepID=UPI0027342E0E|nr:hypothetical protein [Daejeonella sp.]MDP3468290.1 hypothetical protein [Daejeonella sp.]